jgi:hypothetical protein
MADVQPSVPLLAYLFAARLLPGHQRVSSSTQVPCTHEQVPTRPLAVLLFTTAFWSLRQQGLIELVPDDGSGNGLIRHHRDVAVRRLGAEARPGLEGAVMDHLDGAATVCDVVSRWSGDGSVDPWHDAVHEGVAEALMWGYLREVPRHGGVIARFLWRESEFEADCARIASLDRKFEHFSGQWAAFRDLEGAFHDHLVTECKRSLLSCTEAWYA